MTELAQQQLFDNVLKAQQGDVSAFSTLVAQTQNLVTSTALAVVHDVQASEDIAQNTFVAVWQQLQELKSPDSFLPWIRQITRNKAKNYLRDNKVTRHELHAELDDDVVNAQQQETDLNRIEAEQINRLVMNVVSELPAESRDILILYYREQQNSGQVARLLDLSEANVRQKLSRIRNEVKKELLESVGEYLFSTIPTVGFTTMVTSAITTSMPAAAASVASSSASQASGVMKLLALGGGALLGGLLAIVAIFFAAWLSQRNLSDEQQKQLIKKHARGQAIWVLLCSVLFAAAYLVDDGWLAPVLVYSALIIGLWWQQRSLMTLIKDKVIQCHSQSAVSGWMGLILGAGVGFIAMLIGLVNSGRLVF
ncbi:RNA polymerase sigma factor [Planctobacterium marinum]|uniref:RNA polymerase sigma factor n=1 Tax=Planctobacterium marinum TaxID=1631968 RepID=A0AA48HRS9_9ALTE|nr:hypothetical protein MACH26_39580 [Planctobacterium marinum]